jgi:hypothetical protein
MAASYFLLLAQKKVTKEKGTLGFAPSPKGEGSLRADGFGPQGIPALLSESARSLAPPALRAADPSALRRYSEGTRRAKRKKPTCRIYPVSHISGASAAGAAALCSSGFPLGRGEQVEEIAARSAGARRMRVRPISAHGCAVSGPRSLLAKFAGHGCPANRGREGAFFFGYFLLGKQKKVTGRQDGGRKTQGRESVSRQRPTTNPTPSPPNPPLEGRAKEAPTP